jgi:methyltransferase (TIGR00027 family)
MSDRASVTAFGVAMLRAAHQVIDDEPRVLVDPVVIPLLGPETETHIRANRDRFRTPGMCALRAHVVLRSRFAEDRLHAAAGRGVRQAVVLGAGYDTFGYRQPEWARDLRIVEVDQPVSQQAKRERLQAASIAVPSNVTFAAVDFERETIDEGLTAAGFDPRERTFVSCLGVIVYLTRDAVVDLFRFVAALPAGSECAFTFGGASEPLGGASPLAEMAARVGEPWRSHLEIDEVRALLANAGLGAPETLTTEQAWDYLGTRRDGLTAPRRQRIATVIV